MNHQQGFSGTCLAVAVLLLLSVSVHPAMAADAVNHELNSCAGCSTGEFSSIPGFKGKNVPVTTIREVSRANGLFNAATASDIPSRRAGSVSLNITDPRAEHTFRQDSEVAAETGGVPGDLPGALITNLSEKGFVFTAQSEVHRYETVLTSDDFLSLNSSQKETLAAAGFAPVSTDTIRSYRDVTYTTFANQNTGTIVYVMAVQQLDANGNATGEQKYSVSPEYPVDTGAIVTTSGFSTASTIERNGSCFWNWVSVSLLTVALILEIVVLAGEGGWAWGFLVMGTYWVSSLNEGDGTALFSIEDTSKLLGEGNIFEVEINITAFYTVGILTGLLILILLAYEIYNLGVCMKWWDEISWESVAWTYQERAGYADNGKTLPVALHDRIAVALPVNTSIDKKAAWVPDLSGAGGLVSRNTRTETIGNSIIQAWLFEANREGPQELVFRYVTTEPVTPDISATTFTLMLPVQPGNWKIMFVDNSSNRYGTGLYTSLVFDKTGTPHISSYDAGDGRIRYSTWNGTGWESETVARSAGTYSTSLAFDKAGNPAISFGDGYHFGNLMFAIKNGTDWETVTVARGSAGDAGQDSSLIFDKNNVPNIAYNDGQNFATLKFATRNGTDWENAPIDNGGPVGDTGYGSSLRLDRKGFPHVVYTSGRHYASLMYAENTGAGWRAVTVDNGCGMLESTGLTPSLALDSQGIPHISYYNLSGKDLMYAIGSGFFWEYETVDSINDVGAYSSLAIDAGDRPHISYYDASSHELRYATKIGDSWIRRTIDNDGKVGQFSSLALDPAGHPCFAYFDDTHHALKYAGWTG